MILGQVIYTTLQSNILLEDDVDMYSAVVIELVDASDNGTAQGETGTIDVRIREICWSFIRTRMARMNPGFPCGKALILLQISECKNAEDMFEKLFLIID